MKKVTFIFIFISLLIRAGNPPAIIFKENKGQWPEKVLFGADILNTQFYVNKNSFNYCVYNYTDLKKGNEVHHKESVKNSLLHCHNYEVEFIGADLNNFTKTKEQPEYYNYFLGNNKNKWASKVKAYENVVFNDIYEGIDLKLYSNSVNLKYDFIVKPNTNINSLKLNYKHVDGLEIRNNELLIKTSVGTITEKAPFAYQNINGIQKQVKCNYILLKDDLVGFVFSDGYNKNYELVIDPTVVVCSYSGYTGWCAGSASTYDSQGNIYNTGYGRQNYPTTPGAFCSTYYGYYDVVLSVYNSSGTSKFYSTYIGGDSLDLIVEPIVTKNEIILSGLTFSEDFPCSNLAFDTVHNGRSDIFISKLSLDCDSLYSSTYVGGSDFDGGYLYGSSPTVANGLDGRMESVVDAFGNIYVITGTNSLDFPVTGSAISSARLGMTDACVFKLDNNLSNLAWSTYLGGTKDESGKAIRLDGSGGVYCFGTTTSTNYPVSSGVISTVKSGGVNTGDMFLTHFNSSGALIASTYIGTTVYDYAGLMDIDFNGDIYLCGHLASGVAFPVTPGLYNNPNGYNTIYKINPSLTNIIYRTRFGFPPPPVIPAVYPYLMYTAFRVDSCQNLYLAGSADNVLPTTSNQVQPYAGGISDIYVAVFGQNCSSLKFASYFGGPVAYYGYGEHCDGGINHFDSKGYLYQTICSNGGLPTTSGAYAPTFISSGDSIYDHAFLKIDLGTFINAGSSYGANITGCPPFTTHFVSTSNTGTSYWNLGDGTTTTLDTITHTYNNLGTYNVLLVVTDTNTCNRYDSIKSVLNVISPTSFDLGEEAMACINSPAYIQSNVSAVTYSWSSGETTPNIYASPGTYTLTINNGGCNSSDDITVVIGEKKLSERFPNVVTPNGDNINDKIELKNYYFEEVDLHIYDRWGREVFKTNDPVGEWHPENLNSGTYYYVAEYRSSCIGKFAQDKGFISIFK